MSHDVPRVQGLTRPSGTRSKTLKITILLLLLLKIVFIELLQQTVVKQALKLLI